MAELERQAHVSLFLGFLIVSPNVDDMLLAMNSTLAQLQARSALAKMNRLRAEIENFAVHAKTLNSGSRNFDSRTLLDEANRLLQGLTNARADFLSANSQIETLARSLPSRSMGVGISPAAQWVPELRAASKRFELAVRAAESSLGQMYGTATAGMNSPTRTATPAGNLFEAFLNFVDLLTRWIEYKKRTPGTR